MPAQPDEPQEVTPVEFGSQDIRASGRGVERKEDEVDLSNAREISPFKIINRGEDTVHGDNVVFSDFSPRVLPSDGPDVETVPKGESAPGPVPSSESVQTAGQTTSDTSVQTPASKEAGTSEAGKQTSSSAPNDG